MSIVYSQEEIEALRDLRYHRTPALCVGSEEQALAYIDEVGFCFLFGDKQVEIPTLWAAVCGSRRTMPNDHFDPAVGRTWEWKDSLPSRGEVYYGKVLRGKPTLVSLALVPCFYALSPNYGDEDDYLTQYQEGKLGAEAKAVYEVLRNEGAQATSRLRQLAGLPGGGANARRFERAIAELQANMMIVKAGISDANRWGYAYVYDLFLRRFPDVSETARTISTDSAMETLLLRYLHDVIAQPEARVRRVFRWEPWEWERLLERLERRGRLRRDVCVEGLAEPCLAESDPPRL